jgi:aminoglycoside phosphotransferase (APT) family kinase protein
MTATSTTSHAGADERAIVAALAERLFPRADASAVRRVPEGVSTRVYRILAGSETFYLRVLPEVEDSFAPEVSAHALLWERGVRVPRVVYWEHRNPEVGHSVMVTAAIAGEPLGQAASRLTPGELRGVLLDAGCDLAALNGVPVAGFGWVRRDTPIVARLEAEQPTFRAFALEFLDADLATLRNLGTDLLGGEELAAVRWVIAERERWLDAPQGFLAHGDFDVTHIYVAGSRYSGIIDLGEMRGTDPLYDLAHFNLHDGGLLPPGLLPPLLEGYAAAHVLPADYAALLELLALLIGIRALARRLGKHGCDETARHLARAIRAAITSVHR